MSDPQFCSIAQDLMPLQLDGVCSKESEAFLRRHMAACENCRKAYAALVASVPAAAPKGDAQAPARAFHRFFRRRTVKSTLIALGCVIACLVIGFGVYTGLWGDKSHPLDLKRYDISLCQPDYGLVAARVTYEGTDRGYVGGSSISGGTEADGRYVLHIAYSSSLIPERDPVEHYRYSSLFYLYEGRLYHASVHADWDGFYLALNEPVDELRQGTESDYRVVYQTGDEISACDDPDYAQFVLDTFVGSLPRSVWLTPRDEWELTVPLPEELAGLLFQVEEGKGA
ncbi:MAG: zf-HC2 domain-containing protein [Clostridia bacterium]|nr:zf-HC2 domain-containing protein [Clostridia bacterium]